MSAPEECVIIGAGPAGLTTAYELGLAGRRALVLEADDQVGGLSRTCQYKGYRFDVGGHRFFTKVDYVMALWQEILGEEFLTRPRLSRIHYRGRLFDYPLKPLNALAGLGPVEAVRIGLSYARAVLFPEREERTFDQWVSNRFGRRLYEIFFETYTEKVWGMPCSEISAEWASQRIKNLDLGTAIRNAVLGTGTSKGGVVSTLVDRFHYPRFGPGQMWERCAERVEAQGSRVLLGAPVSRLEHDGGRVRRVVVTGADGETVHEAEQVVSSMAIQPLVRQLDPAPPPEVLAAADRLRYRDFLTVALIVDRADLFPDNWIYIHSADVRVGRVQNYKNWSPDMVPDPSRTALGFEYFVQEGDALWSMPDDELVALARQECDRLGLAPADAVEDGCVLRMRKAYPVYDDAYAEALATLRGWLGGLSNLQLIGRNGQHRYNNQDHSMMTGVLAARNLDGAGHDIWSVNVDLDYHEERQGGDRAVPAAARERDIDSWIREAFAVYDPLALATAVGVMAGGGLFLATAVLLLRGDDPLGPNLSLLGQYVLGFSVSWGGALLGLLEAGLLGFAFGWALAGSINVAVAREKRRLMLRIGRRRALAILEGEQA